MNIGLLLPKGGPLRRAVQAFVGHPRSHVTGAALPGRYTCTDP